MHIINNSSLNNNVENSENINEENHNSELNNNNNNDICPICLDDSSEKIITTKCGHKFHLKCLLKWLRGNELKQQCPYCRQFIYGFIFNMNQIHNYDNQYYNYLNNDNRYLNKNSKAKLSFNECVGNITICISHLSQNNKDYLQPICINIERKELCNQLINIEQPYYWCDTKDSLLPMFLLELPNNKQYIISSFYDFFIYSSNFTLI